MRKPGQNVASWNSKGLYLCFEHPGKTKKLFPILR